MNSIIEFKYNFRVINAPIQFKRLKAIKRQKIRNDKLQQFKRFEKTLCKISTQEIVNVVLAPHPGLVVGCLANTLVYILGIKILLKGMLWSAVLHSWILGTTVFAAFGCPGYFLICLYFIFGSYVTKIRLKEKKAAGIAESRSGRRSIGSVYGSGLASIICSVMALITQDYPIYQLGAVAAITSKFSDTVSSEIGKAFGKTTYLITNFSKCKKGTEGAISLEGTFAGILAALIFSFIAYFLGQIEKLDVLIVFCSAFIANILESYVGAVFQKNINWLSNDVVNMLQICFACLFAMSLKIVFLNYI